MRRGARRIATVARAAALLLPLLGCSKSAPPAPPPPATRDGSSARYVGIAACVDCHKDKATTFARTGMGRSAYPMSAAVAVEDFTHRNEIEIAAQGKLRYRMTARAGKYFMRQFLRDATGAERDVDEREMAWVIGSGNHSRSYVTRVGDKLFQMPVCWYPQTSEWDLCPGYEEKNDRFTREISESCAFCHNARMELLPGARNEYREPIPAGIDCERCHGPGERHVARWREGSAAPAGAGDATIVNPARLPAAERIQVCFQCHLGDSKATERVVRPARSLSDWRPGIAITEAMIPFWMKAPNREEFGISAQADRFLRSRCFTRSGGKLECLSCHDPHVPVYEKRRSPTSFRDVCLSCHQASACTADPAARRATLPLPDDCVACHMKKSAPDDHPHTTFTDHWIRIPGAGEVASAHPGELEPALPAAFDALAAPERDYIAGRAYFLKSLDFPESVRNAMWQVAKENFQAAIGKDFHAEESWFFVGKILTYERRTDEAATAFRSAVALDPADHDAALALATALNDRSQVADAEAVLRGILAHRPDDAGALAELARSTAAVNASAAVGLIERAIAAEPWNARLHMNRAVLLSAVGRRADAIAACTEAMRLDPVNARVRQVCGGI